MATRYQVKYFGNIGFQCTAGFCPKHNEVFNGFQYSKNNLSQPIQKHFKWRGCQQYPTQVFGLTTEYISEDAWNNVPHIAVVIPALDPTGAQDPNNPLGVTRDIIFEAIWRATKGTSIKISFIPMTRGYSFKKVYHGDIVPAPVGKAELTNCYPYFERDLLFLNPTHVLMCGVETGKAFFGDFFTIPEYRRRKQLSITLAGRTFPTQVTYFPHICLTSPPYIKSIWEDCLKLFETQESKYPIGTDFKIIEDIKSFDTYVDFLEQWDDYIATDTETENLNRVATNRLATVQFSTDASIGYVIPIEHKETPFSPNEIQHVKARLFTLFNNKARCKAWLAHSAKFENVIYRRHFGTMMESSYIFDTQAGAYLLDETRSERKGDIPRGGGMYSLKQLSRDYLGFEGYSKAILLQREEGNLFNIPLKDLGDYGATDVKVTYALNERNLNEAIAQNYYKQFISLNKHFYTEATKLIAEIEINGFKADLAHLRKLSSKFGPLETKLAYLQNEFQLQKNFQEANKLMVEKTNAGIKRGVFGKVPWILDLDKPSVKQLVFFDVMGLEPVSFSEKTGMASIDDEFYKEYAEDYKEVELVRAYEEAKKMKSTFIEKVLKKIDPKVGSDEDSKLDQRVRSNINYSQLVTGRWAMSNPNLAQIPRAEEVNDDSENEFLIRKSVKDIFTVDKGCALVQIDYKVNEVRWAGILSKDASLAKIFKDAAALTAEAVRTEDAAMLKKAAFSEDIHKQTAALMFNKSIEEVTKKERQISKCVHPNTLLHDGSKYFRIGSLSNIRETDTSVPLYGKGLKVLGPQGLVGINAFYSNGKDTAYGIVTRKGVIVTSARHQILTLNRGLVKAEELKLGDEVEYSVPMCDAYSLIDLETAYQLGSNCKDQIPLVVLNSSLEIKVAFLKGLLQVQTIYNLPNFITASIMLASDLSVLFNQLKLDFYIDIKNSQFIFNLNKKTTCNEIIEITTKLPELQHVPLVDIEVDSEEHLYWASGFTTHNTITFGILFQQSAKALAAAVGLSLEEAEKHIANFFSKMTDVAAWIEKMKTDAQTKGYVEAEHGRRRRFWAFHIPESYGGRRSLINRNLRQCVNAPIQGCQDENDFINTDKGLVRLKELDPTYHAIYTYTGKTNDYVVHDTGVKDVYWFETTKGTARVSLDHRFMVFDTLTSDLQLKRTSELNETDWVVASDLDKHVSDQMLPTSLILTVGKFINNKIDNEEVARLLKGQGSSESCVQLLQRLPTSLERDNLIDLCQHKWAQINKIELIGKRPTKDIEILHRGKFTEHVYHSHGLLMHNCASDAAMIGGAGSLRRYIKQHNKKWLIQNVVHDSCLIQVPMHEVVEVLSIAEHIFVDEAQKVLETMGVQFNLPLGCDAECGISWGSLEKWDGTKTSAQQLQDMVIKYWADRGVS